VAAAVHKVTTQDKEDREVDQCIILNNMEAVVVMVTMTITVAVAVAEDVPVAVEEVAVEEVAVAEAIVMDEVAAVVPVDVISTTTITASSNNNSSISRQPVKSSSLWHELRHRQIRLNKEETLRLPSNFNSMVFLYHRL
jgi:hypothetical protein